jgi:YHS domain-containing protein
MKTFLALIVAGIAGLSSVSLADSQAPKPVPYPMQTCFISGDKLGEMGKPVVFTYQGQEIKLCCKDCKKKFDANPAQYMKQFEAAKKKAAKDSSTMDPNLKKN